MSHGVNKKAHTIVSPLPPNHVFTRFVCCFTRNTLSTFLCSDLQKLLQTIMHFQFKKIFSFKLLLVGFDMLFYVYVFLRVFFHISCFHIRIASYLAPHQIMWHNKRIHGHGLKIQAVSFSKKTKFKVNTTSIILSYIYHYGNVNK